MTYYCELKDKKIELDNIFVENSKLIQMMLKDFKTDTIPLINEFCTEENIINTTFFLKNLINNEYQDEITFLLMKENIEKIVGILELSDYCDINIVSEFLINHVAEFLRKNNSIEELEKMLIE